MHGDKKVGLALAILLVGTVSALFFRNEPEPALAPPQLKDPAALDEEIAQKQHNIPYLQDAETAENSAGQTPKTTEPQQRSRWEMPEFLKETRVDSSAGPPDPIASADQDSGTIPVPRHNKHWSVSTQESPPKTKTQSTALSKSLRTHRVREGETLSGLAKRYLGSSARFLEIYWANRDRLKSPNDLREGMMITIPDAKNSGWMKPTAASSRRVLGKFFDNPNRSPSTVEDLPVRSLRNGTDKEPAGRLNDTASSEDSEPSKPSGRRFVPVRRNPLLPSLIEYPPAPLPDSAGANAMPSKISSKKTSKKTSKSLATSAKSSSPKNSQADDTGRSPSTQRRYVVQPGDSLERIALKVYGKRSATEKIFAANRNRFKNRNVLRAGMTLILPD